MRELRVTDDGELMDTLGVFTLGSFRRFRKRVLTRAVRVDGPFKVKTLEGELSCGDGWLCLDAHGNPYPVGADEFDAMYEEVKE